MHGGNLKAIAEKYKVSEKDLIDFSVNINPLGYPEYTRQVLSRNLETISHYPDPEYTVLRRAIAERNHCDLSNIIVGNGTSEILFFTLFQLKPQQLILPVPSYIDYQHFANQLDIEVRTVLLKPENQFELPVDLLKEKLKTAPEYSAVLLANPNNPTGSCIAETELLQLSAEFPDIQFILDEAYADFLPQKSNALGKNIIRIRSLTKNFAIPGLRLGYALTNNSLAESILNTIPPWSVNSLAEALGFRIIQDPSFLEQSVKLVEEQRAFLYQKLSEIPEVKLFSTASNFILFQLLEADPASFYERMIQKGIVLRWCDDYEGLDQSYFRIGIKDQNSNRRLVQAFQEYFGKPSQKEESQTPALIFLGTSSNAGKSLMTTAYCRVLSDMGYKVAPFKAQNMSLNSAVTSGGFEIGRAQALQAAAARVKPDPRMNPVLLKPNSDTGSQVVVNGVPWKNLNARNYYDTKETLQKAVHTAYDSLAAEYDVIVLEGAGSPGEVNLKKYDMVNMPMARYAESQAILVGDIDRGGVYASFIGHMEVMEEWERELTAGFLVNKFRGDATLLTDAHSYLKEHTGKEVLGVMPYARHHHLPEEDGVDFWERYGSAHQDSAEMNIGILALPHISNSTDIDPLLNYPDLGLIQIKTAEDLKKQNFHLIIIPGSKNPISDMQILEKDGIADTLRFMFIETATCFLGICGGFQILGDTIADPSGVETSPGNIQPGLGLLPLSTQLAESKTLEITNTRLLPNQAVIEGYEIHHGISEYKQNLELFTDKGLGAYSKKVWGTYLHGILDNHEFTGWLLNEVRRVNNLAVKDYQHNQNENPLEKAIDEFTAVFKESVDIQKLLLATGLK